MPKRPTVTTTPTATAPARPSRSALLSSELLPHRTFPALRDHLGHVSAIYSALAIELGDDRFRAAAQKLDDAREHLRDPYEPLSREAMLRAEAAVLERQRAARVAAAIDEEHRAELAAAAAVKQAEYDRAHLAGLAATREVELERHRRELMNAAARVPRKPQRRSVLLQAAEDAAATVLRANEELSRVRSTMSDSPSGNLPARKPMRSTGPATGRRNRAREPPPVATYGELPRGRFEPEGE
jgi:hypothetical protein